MSPSPDLPLNDVERDRMDALLSSFNSEDAMNNAEQFDGFFAALICSPEIAKPNEYLAEIWGEMTDDEAFASEQEFQDFLSLLMRPWNSIGRKLEDDDVFTPLLFEDEEGSARANDWAGGFMRGTHLHHENWKELIADEEHGGPLVPILALAYEHDLYPEMRPYKDWVVCERLLPQAYTWAELINHWGFEFPEAARLLNHARFYLYERGYYTEAKPLYERALVIREKTSTPSISTWPTISTTFISHQKSNVTPF
jgi:yecA family protein